MLLSAVALSQTWLPSCNGYVWLRKKYRENGIHRVQFKSVALFYVTQKRWHLCFSKQLQCEFVWLIVYDSGYTFMGRFNTYQSSNCTNYPNFTLHYYHILGWSFCHKNVSIHHYTKFVINWQRNRGFIQPTKPATTAQITKGSLLYTIQQQFPISTSWLICGKWTLMTLVLCKSISPMTWKDISTILCFFWDMRWGMHMSYFNVQEI